MTHHQSTETGLVSIACSWGMAMIGSIFAWLHDLPAAAVIGSGGGIIASLITYVGMTDAKERRRLTREVEELARAGAERDRKLAAAEAEIEKLHRTVTPEERGR